MSPGSPSVLSVCVVSRKSTEAKNPLPPLFLLLFYQHSKHPAGVLIYWQKRRLLVVPDGRREDTIDIDNDSMRD
eukprot:1193056-Prorocentrum_minimum.AAC.1